VRARLPALLGGVWQVHAGAGGHNAGGAGAGRGCQHRPGDGGGGPAAQPPSTAPPRRACAPCPSKHPDCAHNTPVPCPPTTPCTRALAQGLAASAPQPGELPLTLATSTGASAAGSQRGERYSSLVSSLSSSLKQEYANDLMLFCFFFRCAGAWHGCLPGLGTACLHARLHASPAGAQGAARAPAQLPAGQCGWLPCRRRPTQPASPAHPQTPRRRLSPLQFALAATSAYPWFPDPVRICALLGAPQQGGQAGGLQAGQMQAMQGSRA
jgi:hypothetical protein